MSADLLRVEYLDADNDAAVFDEPGEGNTIVGFLVEGFMEEDDASDTAVDALVGGEEQLTVAAPVLLSVLDPDGVETLRHATCNHRTQTLFLFFVDVQTSWLYLEAGIRVV